MHSFQNEIFKIFVSTFISIDEHVLNTNKIDYVANCTCSNFLIFIYTLTLRFNLHKHTASRNCKKNKKRKIIKKKTAETKTVLKKKLKQLKAVLFLTF